jgi:hypothetical protein
MNPAKPTRIHGGMKKRKRAICNVKGLLLLQQGMSERVDRE